MSNAKRALITGGTSGIGYATAQHLIQQGYQVVITGSEKTNVERVAKELGAQGFAYDFAVANDFSALADVCQEGLDVLVNNAGIAPTLPLGHFAADIIQRAFNVNVVNHLLLIQSLRPTLVLRAGCVVNVSSVITEKGMPAASLYAATKGAIEAMTRSLAVELAPQGVRVNAVSPGAIDTPIFGKMGIPAEALDQVKAQVMATIPVGKLGQPLDVAKAIQSMAENSYVNGAIWRIDGGVTAA